MMNKHFQKGYSLIELAVVIAIISVVAGGALVMTAAKLDAAQIEITKKRMEKIEQAIFNFRKANNRLPCPANITLLETNSAFGTESTPTGDCTTTSISVGDTRKGAVPVRALGLTDDFVYDGWGNRFTYTVQKEATASNAFNTIPLSSTTEYMIPSMQNDWLYAGLNQANIYVLISHGPNGHGAFGRNGAVKIAASPKYGELTNCKCDASGAFAPGPNLLAKVYYVDSMTSTDNNRSDDIVIFKSRAQLAGPNE